MQSTADASETTAKAAEGPRNAHPPTPPGVGVMGGDYAKDRTRRPHLVFRFQTRALIAAQMFQRFGPRPRPEILDLGAAEGRTMARTHEILNASRSVGVEFSQDLIAAAGQLPAGCSLVQGDATAPHPAIAPGCFDLVTALAVLEHVEDPIALCRRAFDALRPGGVFVATCPSGLWDSISGAIGLHKDEHHTGAFNRQKFERVASAAGLTPRLYQRFMLAPIGFLPYMGIKVSPAWALKIDRIFAPVPVVNLSMVNQVFVAIKPA